MLFKKKKEHWKQFQLVCCLVEKYWVFSWWSIYLWSWWIYSTKPHFTSQQRIDTKWWLMLISPAYWPWLLYIWVIIKWRINELFSFVLAVASSLPTTSSIKPVEYFLLYNIVYPFATILLAVLIQVHKSFVLGSLSNFNI